MVWPCATDDACKNRNDIDLKKEEGKRGRPRTNQRRMVIEETRSVGIGFGNAARLAQDEAIWKDLLRPLLHATKSNEPVECKMLHE